MSDLELQLQVEQQAYDRGIKRYRRKQQGGESPLGSQKGPSPETTLPPGLSLLYKTIGPVAEAITETITSRGRPPTLKALVEGEGLEPEVLAYLTGKHCIDAIVRGAAHTTTCVQLGQACVDELDYRLMRAEVPALHRYIEERNKLTGNTRIKRIRRRRAGTYAGVSFREWDDARKLAVGCLLIELFRVTTGLIQYGQRRGKGRRRGAKTIEGVPAVIEKLAEGHRKCEILRPLHLPMVVQPKPWTRVWGNPYHHRSPTGKDRRVPLCKVPFNSPALEEMRAHEGDMQPVFDAVNAIQSTAWRVNERVREVAQKCWDLGLPVEGLVQEFTEPPPAKPADIGTNPKAKQRWKRAASAYYEKRVRLVSKRLAAMQKLHVADEFEGRRIYFPVQLDFRGRVYPLTGGLNPQEDDLARGLLHFDEGVRLGREGARWLAIHGANVYGEDKLSLDDREIWVRLHEKQILRAAHDPLNLGLEFWSHADKPWQFLAFCFEWAEYKLKGEDTISTLPVALDGTCNGLQHLTALMRDEGAAHSVNLSPNGAPHDIYQEVADSVIAAGVDEAVWPGRVDRALVKRNVMTLPYGVSRYGMRNQIMEHLRREAMRAPYFSTKVDEHKAACYMADLVYESIGRVVGPAMKCMDWLQEVVRVCNEAGVPVTWTAPSGLRVQQRYALFRGRRIDTNIGSLRLRGLVHEPSQGKELDKRKQASSIAPNYIHSLDAAHMVATINLCRGQMEDEDGNERTVQAFAMVHDSFGCHAGEAPVLVAALREAFADMHTPDLLARFRDEVLARLPAGTELPPIPARGRLDIDCVRDSDYFFS